MTDWFVQEWAMRQEQIVPLLKFLFQIAVLTGIIYFIYVRFIRRSHAEQLLKGLFIMLLIFVGMLILANIFKMPMLENVFAAGIQILFIGLIVIFQPELRRMLLFLGQGELFGVAPTMSSPEEQKAEFLVQELSETVHFLSKAKRGALIVLEAPSSHGGDYLEMGTPLDAKLSTELLLTIFHHNTPLHDGAVVIGPDNRVVAAGVLLPLTEDPKLSWQYGTRHRAAIGLTELSDSRCIVVSEETGVISLVEDGKLEKMANAEELKKTLARLYQVAMDTTLAKKVPLGERLTEFLSVDALPNPIQRIFAGRQERREEKEARSAKDKLPKSGTGG
jgi:diadenylate cyclase